MAERKEYRTPYYGAIPPSQINAENVIFSNGESLTDTLLDDWELIAEKELTEEITRENIMLNKKYKEFYIESDAVLGDNDVEVFIIPKNNVDISSAKSYCIVTDSSKKYNESYIKLYNNAAITVSTKQHGGNFVTPNEVEFRRSRGFQMFTPQDITYISIRTSTDPITPLPIGYKYKIYGRAYNV